MKTIHQTMIIPASLGLLGILPALAIEPPKDDAPPPPSVKPPEQSPADSSRSLPQDNTRINSPPTPDAPQEKVAPAFIGIISDDIPELLSAHIGIKQGEGVLVRDLAPGGPAEKAGIARFDVITHLNSRTVGSPAELSQTITALKPGDEVSFDLIHRGAKVSKTVKLESRPDHSGQVLDTRNLGHLDLDDIPEGQASRIRDMIDRQIKGMMRQSSDHFRELNLQHGNTPDDFPDVRPQRNGFRGFQFRSDATFRFMDNDGSIEMKSSDGKKDITVRDHQGNEVWSGPWDTEDDKSAAPKDVRERIDKFNFADNLGGGGFRFRMGGRGDSGLRESR